MVGGTASGAMGPAVLGVAGQQPLPLALMRSAPAGVVTASGVARVDVALQAQALAKPKAEKPQDEFLSEEDRRWWNAPGDLLGGVGDRLEMPGLSSAASTAKAPSAVARALGVAWHLVTDPGSFFGRFGKLFSNPVGVIGSLVDDIGALVGGIGSATRVVGQTVKGTEHVADLVKARGVAGGVRALTEEARAKARLEAAQVAGDLKGGVGVGARPMLKKLASSGASAAEKAAKRAMLGELGQMAPKAFAKTGLWARSTGFIGRVFGRVGEVAWALRSRADKLADGLASLLGRTKLGTGLLKVLDKLNPLSRVAEGTAQRTLAGATAKGVEAATKATAEVMAKKGIALGATEAARLAASGEKAASAAVARVGAKASGKGLSRFLPALNIAMAAYDTYRAVRIWMDPKASGWKKGFATATAIFSWAAASNVPGLSQVGAVGAVVSSVLEGLSPEGIAKGAKAVGGFFAKVGKGIWGGLKGLFG